MVFDLLLLHGIKSSVLALYTPTQNVVVFASSLLRIIASVAFGDGFTGGGAGAGAERRARWRMIIRNRPILLAPSKM